jgi:two-component system nitrate/nitrite response regulator NarL
MRAGINEILAADRIYRLLAVAETGAECLDAIQRFQPDLALIDLKISQPGAKHILRELRAKGSQTRICFLADGKIPPRLLEGAKQAAAVFANKRSPDDLRNRLLEIASELSSKTPATTSHPAAVRESAPAQKSERLLTNRQKQIVTMLKLGASNRDIARALGVVEGTVKVHLHRIFQRLGVANRTQLAAQSFAVEEPTQPDLKPGATRKT